MGAKLSPRALVGIALGGAVLLTAILISASLVSGSEPAPPAPPGSHRRRRPSRDSLLRGIPQDGIALGDPKAPVTLVEYADLQCLYCADWARDAFPAIVDEYVASGKVRIVFRGLAFLGPDSDKALRAALAAGEQDALWNVVHGLFTSQGPRTAAGSPTGCCARSAAMRGSTPTGCSRRPTRPLSSASSPRPRRPRSASACRERRSSRPGRPAALEPLACQASTPTPSVPSSTVSCRRERPPAAGRTRGRQPRRRRGHRLSPLRALGLRPLYCSTGAARRSAPLRMPRSLGVPVAAAGLLAYLALGASAFFSAPLVRVGAAALALAAVAFSAYLLVVQLVVIDAVCTWCVVSDVLVSLAAVAAMLRLRELLVAGPPEPTSRAAQPRARSGRAPRGSRDGASA